MSSSAFHSSLRDEIAAAAARLIAEDGMDYAGAKRRAAREVANDEPVGADMPDNATIEEAVRTHHALFMADSQPARLASLRRTAVDAMRHLDAFGPSLVGAVLNGTAGEHSDIHLSVVDDNAKDIEIFLLNAGVDFDVAEGSSDGSEVLSFQWPPRSAIPGRASDVVRETVHLSVVDPRAHRSMKAGRSNERANLAAVEALIAASEGDVA
jgi:hypothetical protein